MSGGSSGPSPRTRAAIGRSSAAAAGGAVPSPTHDADRLAPAAPERRRARPRRARASPRLGRHEVRVRPRPGSGRGVDRHLDQRPSPAPGVGAAESSPSVGGTALALSRSRIRRSRVAALLLLDDRLDLRGGPVDLAGLVDDDAVVVALARELDGGVALADLQLVGGLGGARAEALEQGLERRRDDEHEQRVRDPLLDDLRALDVDLEDHVVARGERRRDLAPRRPVPVAVDLVGLEQLARLAQRVELGSA